MRSTEKKYTGNDLAIMIPTRDRPAKMRNLLDSLAAQSEQCGRIIVVASGESIEELVLSYEDRLPVEYYECDPPGQIRQRNLAISLLDDRTPLVASLDDDIVVEEDAVEQMISFWNSCEPETAGVSFNIVNNPSPHFSLLRALFGMGSKEPGKVLCSGYNVPLFPAKENFQSQWLCGGATVWRQEVLKKCVNVEINSKWAICEDLIFSYPIGKHYPLYVCATAHVRHEHVYDHLPEKSRHRYYGRNATLWRMYFVESHPELKRGCFVWMIFGQVIARLLSGIVTANGNNIYHALGQLEGIFSGMAVLRKGESLFQLLNE